LWISAPMGGGLFHKTILRTISATTMQPATRASACAR
jgi:hypothetical protein